MYARMTKMFKNVKKSFWWSGVKSNVAELVLCVCHKAKVEHQKLGGFSSQILLSESRIAFTWILLLTY